MTPGICPKKGCSGILKTYAFNELVCDKCDTNYG